MKNYLYNILRAYNLLLSIIPSIAFYRATVQSDYKWGLLAINGKGTSTEYWYLVLFLVFSWATFILESWYKKRWYYFLPLLLFGTVSYVLTYGYLTEKVMVFQGDAWKFKFDIGIVLVFISVLLFIANIIWTSKDIKRFSESNFSVSKLDKLHFTFVLSLSAIIFILFAQGKGGVHTNFDKIAVGLTVIQALLMANIIDRTSKSDKNKRSTNR